MPLLYGEGDRAFIRLQEEILKATDDQSIFAWKCFLEDPLRFQLCGLLASSPSFFAAAAPLKPLPRDRSRVSAPFSMTNAGLHIRLFLKAISPAGGSGSDDKADEARREFYGVLGCAPYLDAEGESYSAAIHLTSLGGDQYARVYPDTMGSLPSSLLANQANPVHGDGFQYIYVKQLPAYGLPEITVGPFEFESRAPPWLQNPIKIMAAYPPDPWNESTLTLKPAMTLPNTVLGAFRYALADRDGRLGDAVDIFIGLGPGSEGPRMFWCAQQRAPASGPKTLAEVAIAFNSTKITKKMRSAPQDQHPLFNVLARVLTVRLHTRTMIRLSLSEIHESTGGEGFGPDAGGSNPVGAGLVEIDSRPIEKATSGSGSSASKPITASLQDAQPFVSEESWDTSLGFGVLELPQALLQTRIRVPGKPADLDVVSQDYLSLRHLVASLPQPIELRLEDDVRSGHTADDGAHAHVQRYFSLLLAQAAARNDIDSAAELLRSPLSNATVEVQTCLQSPDDTESPPWHSAFRRFRPIHWAVVFGHRDMVELLLAHGADVLSTTAIRLSVIHLAVIMGHIKLLLYLREARPESWENTKPEWFEKTDVKEPIAHLAASYIITSRAVVEVLQRFMRKADGPVSEKATFCTNALYNTLHETPLHRAAANDNLAAARAIVSLARIKKPDIDPQDHHGRTPLWHAAAAGAHDVARLLLNHGANLHLPDHRGWVPLHAACRGGHAPVVRLLVERAGAGWHGRTLSKHAPPISAFHLALLSGNADTLRHMLLARGVVEDPSQEFACAGRSFAPIHIAVSNGWLGCVRLLYEACGATIERRTRKEFVDTLIVGPQRGGTVALHASAGGPYSTLGHLAVVYGHMDVVDYLPYEPKLQGNPEKGGRKT